MDQRQARELGEALAFATGDLRDWPTECAWCRSQDLEYDPVRQVFCCHSCERTTTADVAGQDRERRARASVGSGVGGPLVQALQAAEPKLCRCGKAATQRHGFLDAPVLTCDDCADGVMATLIQSFTADDTTDET